MTQMTSMAEASRKHAGFYVPQFKILIDDSPLPGNVLHDVVEITYKDKLEEIDSCEIVVNNWDTKQQCFKYIGSEQLGKDGTPTGDGAKNPNKDLWTLFDPCKKNVELKLGYAPGPLTTMLLGNFVTYEPNFPASGPPVLSVRMLNRLHALRTKKYDKQYTVKEINPLTDTAIAHWMSKQKDPDTKKPRFPIPIKPYDGKTKEPQLTYVIQKSQYDIDFLWQRARMNGYDLRIENNKELVYQPSTEKKTPVYELMWGQSLIDFKPTLTTGNQYKAVTVRAWDRAAQKLIEVKLEYNDPKVGKYNKNLDYLISQCDPREETVVEKPFFTKEQATAYCAGVFADQRKRMVKATGTTVGLPELRAGCKVQIGGAPGSKQTLGSRLSGTYFVTATTHVLNSNGYTTKFEARREDEENTK